jgi:protein-tyrosine phosphatase
MSKFHPQVKDLEYDYIDDGIYIGNNQCCQLHFDEVLKKEEIELDLSLEEDRIDAPFGVDYYVWIPVKDHDAPKIDQLKFGVWVIEKCVSEGKKIYVHCKNGHGRAPTFVAAYLIRKGMGVDEAIEFIRSKRSVIHLEDVQVEFLRKFLNR